jgi:two-component system, NarL family, capsular synthesis sensor histidine kinase RcsC
MRILVADDDQSMRTLWKDMLEALGHEVTVVNDGVEAYRAYVESYADAKPTFDRVLTDYQMPKKNGVVLMMEIRAVSPGQKMVLASADPPTSQLKMYGLADVPVLTKGSIRLADLETALAK